MKKMRPNREQFEANQPPFSTIRWHFMIEEKRRKRELHQLVLKAKNDRKILVVRGASCLLRGRGLNDTGEDEKRRERMGRIPLILTNMVYCVSVREQKKEPQTDLGLRFRML